MRCQKCRKWFSFMLNRQGCPYCWQAEIRHQQLVQQQASQQRGYPYLGDSSYYVATGASDFATVAPMNPTTWDTLSPSGDGGTFSGAGASGNWDSSSSCSSSSYDSSSSSYDSSSSSSSDSGSCSSGSDY